MSTDDSHRIDGAGNGSADGLDSAGLADLLDRWGVDLTSWPNRNLVADARALIDRDAAAHALWLEAKALDGLLDAATAPDVSSGLADRIMAASQAAPSASNVVSLAGAGRNRRFNWPPMALAASLLIGLVVGAGTSPETVDSWLGGAVYAAEDFGIGVVETEE